MNTMLIIQKESRQTVLPTAAFLVLTIVMAALSGIVSPRLFSLFAVIVSGVYIMGSILISERYEDKYNGYRQIFGMPVLAREVAAGKLIVMFLLDVLACALMTAVVRFYGLDSHTLAVTLAFVYLFGCVWLLFIVLMYSGICLLGFTRFMVVFRIVVLGLLVAVQLVLMLLLKSGNIAEMVSGVAESLAGAPWLYICAAVTVGYFGFIPGAAKLMRRYAASGL